MPARPKPAHLRADNRPSRSPAFRGPRASARVTTPPEPPSTMSPRAVPYWVAVWSLSAYVASDAAVIAMYADLMARRDFCMATLEAEGLTVASRGGAEVLHPVFRVLKDTEARLLALSSALGLTPESRLRLGISALETRSRLDAFMDDQAAGE